MTSESCTTTGFAGREPDTLNLRPGSVLMPEADASRREVAMHRFAALVTALLAVSVWGCGTATTSPTQAATPSSAAMPIRSPSPFPSTAPSVPTASPSSVAVASPTPLSRDQAITIARRFAIGVSTNWIVRTTAGPYAQFNPTPNAKVSPPPPDHWVWQVTFDSGRATTSVVILDYYTGTFIETGIGTP